MKNWTDFNYSFKTLANNTRIADGAYILSFKRDFDFHAGQVIALGVATNLAPRLYSVASGEADDSIEILYTEKSGGELTPMLSRLKAGDTVMVSEPFGTFTQVTNEAVYIAAGTGIAPFISKIKSMKGTNPTLIHGVSYPEHFYFAHYLKEALGRNYIQCCSRCQHDDYYQGRVTQLLQSWDGLIPNKKYYLCGSAEMVVDTRDALIARGVAFGDINAEIYF